MFAPECMRLSVMLQPIYNRVKSQHFLKRMHMGLKWNHKNHSHQDQFLNDSLYVRNFINEENFGVFY